MSHLRCSPLAVAFLLSGSGCHDWHDEVIVTVRDPSQVSVRRLRPDDRRGDLPPGRVPAQMNVIETDLIKTRLQRNPDGSISQITEGTRREPERSSAFLSVEGRYVASSVTSLPFHVADVRASPSRMLRLPVRIGEAALDNVYTRVNIDQSVALIAEYAVASNWVLLESPASNVVGAEHRRTPNRAKGWALIASASSSMQSRSGFSPKARASFQSMTEAR